MEISIRQISEPLVVGLRARCSVSRIPMNMPSLVGSIALGSSVGPERFGEGYSCVCVTSFPTSCLFFLNHERFMIVSCLKNHIGWAWKAEASMKGFLPAFVVPESPQSRAVKPGGATKTLPM